MADNGTGVSPADFTALTAKYHTSKAREPRHAKQTSLAVD